MIGILGSVWSTVWSFQVLNRVLYLWQPEAPKKVLWSTFFLRVQGRYSKHRAIPIELSVPSHDQHPHTGLFSFQSTVSSFPSRNSESEVFNLDFSYSFLLQIVFFLTTQIMYNLIRRKLPQIGIKAILKFFHLSYPDVTIIKNMVICERYVLIKQKEMTYMLYGIMILKAKQFF